MHVAKLAALVLLLFHTFIPVQNLQLYAGVSVFLVLIIIYSGKMPLALLFFKNIPIFFFTAVFFVFMFFPAMNIAADNLLTLFKIIFIFNISLAASAWLGRTGFIFCLMLVPFKRIKLFLILLSRSLGDFKRNTKAAVTGVRLRIELTGKQKLLVPKYYMRSLIMKELYSFYHSQAALVSRLRSDNIAIYGQNTFVIKDMRLACIMACVALADIFVQAANIQI